MPTYVYETIPKKPGEKPKRFEIQQSMKDEPLKKHAVDLDSADEVERSIRDPHRVDPGECQERPVRGTYPNEDSTARSRERAW